nr:hypothetical protein [Tanacetum cinerariifolium]
IRGACLLLGKVEKGSANAMEVEKRTAGNSGLNATVDAIQTGEKTVTVTTPMVLVCCWELVEEGRGNGGDGGKTYGGKFGLNATVLAKLAGKKTVLLGLWDFDNVSPFVSEGLSWLILESLKLSGLYNFSPSSLMCALQDWSLLVQL